MTQEKIQEINWKILPHPPYSPDFALSDYFLFRSMEHTLTIREKRFRNITEVENHLTEYFESKPENFLKNGFEKLQGRWETIANKDRDYIL